SVGQRNLASARRIVAACAVISVRSFLANVSGILEKPLSRVAVIGNPDRGMGTVTNWRSIGELAGTVMQRVRTDAGEGGLRDTRPAPAWKLVAASAQGGKRQPPTDAREGGSPRPMKGREGNVTLPASAPR